MIDNTKTLICFTNPYYLDVYLKLSSECLDFLKFLEEKDMLNSDWRYEKIEEIKTYEF